MSPQGDTPQPSAAVADAAFRILLGQFEDAIGQANLDAAVDFAEQLLDLAPPSHVYEQLLHPIDCFAGSDGQMYDMLQKLNRGGVSLSPWSSLLRFSLLRRLGWHNDAIETSIELRAVPERYGWMCYILGLALLNQRQSYSEVRKLMRIVLRSVPRFWKARATLAECALCIGEEGDALSLMDDCISELSAVGRSEEIAEATTWRGVIRLWIGQYRAAIEDFQPGMAWHFTYSRIWSGAAHLLSGEPERAIELLNLGLNAAPTDVEAYFWRGEAFDCIGQSDHAVEDFGRAVHLAGSAVWPRVGRALAQAHRGDLDAALSDFEALPSRLRAFFEWKTGKRVSGDPGAAAEVMVQMRGSARGVRREESYLEPLWMRRT